MAGQISPFCTVELAVHRGTAAAPNGGSSAWPLPRWLTQRECVSGRASFSFSGWTPTRNGRPDGRNIVQGSARWRVGWRSLRFGRRASEPRLPCPAMVPRARRCERVWAGAVAETSAVPARPARSGSAPGCPWVSAPSALGQQQLHHKPGQFPRDVKGGTIGNHVESFSGKRSLARSLPLALHVPLLAARFALMCLAGRIKPARIYFTEITSLAILNLR